VIEDHFVRVIAVCYQQPVGCEEKMLPEPMIVPFALVRESVVYWY